jgi:hypothetical protein
LPELERFIQVNCPLAPVPSVPEIRLHKAGPKSGLWRLAERDDDFGSPYWVIRGAAGSPWRVTFWIIGIASPDAESWISAPDPDSSQ